MLILGQTDKGLLREDNQDVFEAAVLPGGGFAVVCDGMGGHRGGGVASRMACDLIAGAVRRAFAGGVDLPRARAVLDEAAREANRLILEAAAADARLDGMGTTLAACVFAGGEAVLCHAGDSRIYRLREHSAEQLTTDHTVVQMLLERGDITESESRTHPRRNYITRALGAAQRLECDFADLPLAAGDRLLLCTDGLYNCLPLRAMPELAREAERAGSAACFISAANEGGGGDNITAVLIGPGGEGSAWTA